MNLNLWVLVGGVIRLLALVYLFVNVVLKDLWRKWRRRREVWA